MTKYIAEILRQLGINYEEYRTENHWDEESGETWITLHPRSDWRDEPRFFNQLNKLSQCAFGVYKIYWNKNSCYLNIVGSSKLIQKACKFFLCLPARNLQSLLRNSY